MRSGTIAFLSGILLLVQLPVLPGLFSSLILLPCSLYLLTRSSGFRVAGFFLMGMLWAILRAQVILDQGLSREIEGTTLRATGQIVSLPDKNTQRIRFEYEIRSLIDATGKAWPVPGKVRLSWFHTEDTVIPGQVWNLRVRLKRPWGFMNPGGFDYERWLFRHRIRATGYVIKHTDNSFTGEMEEQWINRLRYHLRQLVADNNLDGSQSGLIIALGLGDRSLIPSATREALIRTGINHLLAISGLHIGLVAGLVYFLARRFWSIGRLPLFFPAPYFAALTGIMAAFFYALLAGLSVPTQRSFIMVSVVMLAFFIQRKYAISCIMCFALLLVLLLDPFAILDAGMWLSFLAIIIIAYGMGGRIDRDNYWWRWGRVQYIIAIGLMPLLLFWFKQVSVVGFLANLVAIPWVSLVVVPLVLIGILSVHFSAAFGALILGFADSALELLLELINRLSNLDFAVWYQASPSLPVLLAGIVAVIILLQPKGIPARWLGLLWLTPVLMPFQSRPAENEIRFSLLDVGQGLSAVIHTRNHTLVYDTGARFSTTFNAGSAVVVPYLRQMGIKKIDTLIISHGDNDHIGGSRPVLEEFPDTPVVTSVTGNFSDARASHCYAGQHWQWDGVDFRILYPEPTTRDFTDNNQSCVLMIDNGTHQILLSGDIEKQAEYRLTGKYNAELAATVLVAPHHGSKTSSSTDFINAINPELVLFPVGYRNRFRFPNKDIIARYESRGVPLYDTATSGAILIRLKDSEIFIHEFRKQEKRFWHSVK